jgi:hypothetical protein
MLADLRFEVVEGDQRQDGVAQLGVFVLVDTPEATCSLTYHVS